MRLSRLVPAARLVLVLVAAVTASAMPAGAVAPPGTRNFTAPGYVPDYFSNESGPFHTGAAAARPGRTGVEGYAAPAGRARPVASRSRRRFAHRRFVHRRFATQSKARRHYGAASGRGALAAHRTARGRNTRREAAIVRVHAVRFRRTISHHSSSSRRTPVRHKPIAARHLTATPPRRHAVRSG
jgi:hypothetical protein